ncbi:hypothetical protein BKA63DRAFT_605064 [Paraphoma chrysanthemicola]|nr:hypothetical protein BKA63DRAFT_605064 [Paraphoma chrysanthemicola]
MPTPSLNQLLIVLLPQDYCDLCQTIPVIETWRDLYLNYIVSFVDITPAPYLNTSQTVAMAFSLPSTPQAGTSATLSTSPILAELFLPDRAVPGTSYAFPESQLAKRQEVARYTSEASEASEEHEKSVLDNQYDSQSKGQDPLSVESAFARAAIGSRTSLLANQFLAPAATNWLASTGKGSVSCDHIYLAYSSIPSDLGFGVPVNDLCLNTAGLGESRLTDNGFIRQDFVGDVAPLENAVGPQTEMADLFDWSSWDVDTVPAANFTPSPMHNNMLAPPNFPPHQFFQPIAPSSLRPSSTLNNAPSLAYAANPTQGRVEARITCGYPGCPRTFRRAGDCRRHMGKHQTPGFKCIVADCEKTFYRLDKVRDHCRQGHGIALSG